MSGGVDSSVAAALLKEQGYEVEGVTMRLLSPDGIDEAIVGASAVCEKLGIAHRTVEAHEDFRTAVIRSFATEYLNARTPNPCVVCNEHIKFGLLWDWMVENDFDYLATGHYAATDGVHLKRPHDKNKDQTYFMYRIDRSRLARILFPLADWLKDEVRAYALRHGLLTRTTDESQDACFVSGKDRSEIIESIDLGTDLPGDIVTADGAVVGTHEGITRYTIGQRHGLGVGGQSEPLYVIGLDAASDRVIVGSRTEGMIRVIEGDDIVIDTSAFEDPEGPWDVMAQARYNMRPRPATLEIDRGRLSVDMHTEQIGISPGQSIVCYREDIVIAGGVISCTR